MRVLLSDLFETEPHLLLLHAPFQIDHGMSCSDPVPFPIFLSNMPTSGGKAMRSKFKKKKQKTTLVVAIYQPVLADLIATPQPVFNCSSPHGQILTRVTPKEGF